MTGHVLITGASRGVGASLATACRAAGWRVTGTSTKGGNRLLPLDVTDPAGFGRLSEALGDAPLDLLVCNAGILEDRGEALADGYPADLWARSFAVNVTGVFLTIQTLLPQLRAARGKIAIISSQMGSDEIASGGTLIYRASKAAALNLGRNLAVELKGDGLPVGIYHPGWVRTDMGGPGAAIDAESSAAGLMAEFDRLSLATTGCFRTWDGRDHPF